MEYQLEIHFRDGRVTLNEGEMYVVPKGVEHKPIPKRNVTSCWLSRRVRLIQVTLSMKKQPRIISGYKGL